MDKKSGQISAVNGCKHRTESRSSGLQRIILGIFLKETADVKKNES